MAHEDTIDALNDLIETSKDGEHGFRDAYEHAPTPALKQLFLARADECRDAVAELQQVVNVLGGKPEDSGTLAGAAHRGWASAKGALVGHTAASLLDDAERAEDVAMAHYRSALAAAELPSDARGVIERQFEGLKRNHAQIRLLRDEARRVNA
jgi:uncharacterized protein (TIGR02284 family)